MKRKLIYIILKGRYKFQFYYGPVNAQQTENMHIDEKKDIS